MLSEFIVELSKVVVDWMKFGIEIDLLDWIYVHLHIDGR